MSKDLAADYFARHTSDECFITSDGRVFHTKGTADGHANTLKDNKVETFTRDGKTAETDGEDTGEDEKVKAIEALKAFDASTAKYPEIKALVKALGLETADQKEATLVAALEAQKEIINLEVKE